MVLLAAAKRRSRNYMHMDRGVVDLTAEEVGADIRIVVVGIEIVEAVTDFVDVVTATTETTTTYSKSNNKKMIIMALARIAVHQPTKPRLKIKKIQRHKTKKMISQFSMMTRLQQLIRRMSARNQT